MERQIYKGSLPSLASRRKAEKGFLISFININRNAFLIFFLTVWTFDLSLESHIFPVAP